MTEPDIDALRELLAAAETDRRAPPASGETKALVPVESYLDEDGWQLLWKVVRAVRRSYPAVFALFTEVTLASLVVDHLVAAETTPNVSEVAEALRAVAAEKGPWLVSTPLCNVAMEEPIVQLADDIVLERAHLSDAWLDDRSAGRDDDEDPFAVFRLIGDRLRAPTKWFPLPSDPRLDTRRGAHLLTVEEGTPAIALPRARARAQYALAAWSILSPPEGRELLPDIGTWVPQPYVHFGQRYKRHEQGEWIAREREQGRTITQWGDWPAPGAEVLAAPFEAMVQLERRSAQALLSAAWALFQASRGSRFQLSEQIRNVHTAIDALCEPVPGGGGVEARWTTVTERFGTWDKVAVRGYGPEDVDELRGRLWAARNIATHGADIALIDLGYPAQAERPLRRGAVARGEDLTYSALHADLAPLIGAVRHVIRELFAVMRDSNWDDRVFEKQFQRR